VFEEIKMFNIKELDVSLRLRTKVDTELTVLRIKKYGEISIVYWKYAIS
jgi:hypothetical protein